jgi:NADPH-dependent 2,4-dienoyl-CoA reductase/sulfur reductase-like enzyme
MKFVIIGGDAAGMSAASRAKRNRPDLEVIVLEQTDDVSYSACGMPYNIADPERDINDLVVRQTQVFRENQDIDLRTGHRVTSIDRSNKKVKGENPKGDPFEVPYDTLLIATGASPILPDIPGVELPGVMTLKSLEQGRRIKDFIRSRGVRKAVIIGMGYIALEMVEALHARDIKVDMVKPGPVFLPWMNPEMAAAVRHEIENHGENLFLGEEIKSIEKTNHGLRVVCSNSVLAGDMILVAVGIKPNSELAEEAGLDLGSSGSIAVDKALRTSDRDICAAGDCADAFHVVTGQKTWIPLALRANRAGWAVADNVIGKDVELPGIVGTAVFKVFDMQVSRTGLNVVQAEKAGFDPVEVMIKSGSRAHAHPNGSIIRVQLVGDKKSGRLLGAQLVGKEGVAHRVNAPAVALHAKMTVEAFSQSDLAYAPPFGPTWDPMLVAANQLLKRM